MHAIANEGVRTLSESALKVESGKKKNPLPHRGIEPVLATRRSDAQPSHIPDRGRLGQLRSWEIVGSTVWPVKILPWEHDKSPVVLTTEGLLWDAVDLLAKPIKLLF